MGKLNCLRCAQPMQFLKRENIQLGKTGWLSGDWGNLVAGALDVVIYACPECGKLEFFRGDFFESEAECEYTAGDIAKVSCSQCAVPYDMDYPQCPCCGTKNPNW